MADDKSKGSLSKEQEDKAIKWLKTKMVASNLSCEVCHTKSWTVLNDIVAPMIFDKGAMKTGAITPQFMIMCQNCGNTKYFNAIVSGVIESNLEKKNG